MTANPFQLSQAQVMAFILILMRVAGLFLTSPIFASRNISPTLKASWALLLAFVLFPVIPYGEGVLPVNGLSFGFAVVREMLVGFALGLSAFLLFTGIQLAGQVVDIQMGLGMVNIIDPLTSTQVSVMGQYFYLVASMVFLAVDGHHMLIRAVVDSFNLIPLGGAHFTPALASEMMRLFSEVFWIAFRVGAPVIGALFLTNIAMGVLARTVPQMNVFIVGLPLNMAAGLLMVILSMGFYVFVLQGMFKGMYRDMALLLHTMQ